MPHEKQ
jgi:hypothetical protein